MESAARALTSRADRHECDADCQIFTRHNCQFYSRRYQQVQGRRSGRWLTLPKAPFSVKRNSVMKSEPALSGFRGDGDNRGWNLCVCQQVRIAGRNRVHHTEAAATANKVT